MTLRPSNIEKRIALKPQVEELHKLLNSLRLSAEAHGLPDIHIENILEWYANSVLSLIAKAEQWAELKGRLDELNNIKFIDNQGSETNIPFVQFRSTVDNLLVDWDDRVSQLTNQRNI